jgi:hypothetical protein
MNIRAYNCLLVYIYIYSEGSEVKIQSVFNLYNLFLYLPKSKKITNNHIKEISHIKNNYFKQKFHLAYRHTN